MTVVLISQGEIVPKMEHWSFLHHNAPSPKLHDLSFGGANLSCEHFQCSIVLKWILSHFYHGAM
jgi:hypothetical protein